jgi:SAM-dependent methyltransferase
VDEPALYAQRFDAEERRAKAALWAVLCADFLQRYVAADAAVLDLGAGSCEFINHIRCGAKFAVDGNPAIREYAAADVRTHCGPVHELDWLPGRMDVVFASNLFEHLPSPEALITVLRAAHDALRPGGRLLVIQPNIRFAYREYWDFLDHRLALSDRSLSEAVGLTGFTVRELRPRFLPFSTKGIRLGAPQLLRIYLRCPPLQWLTGKQMLLMAERG